MPRIFIHAKDIPGFDALLEYAKEHRYNLEISTFIIPEILDTNWQEVVKDYQRKLHEFKGATCIHGAGQDIQPRSEDGKIREVSEQRIFQGIEIAKQLKAKYVVFHGNFDPVMRAEGYKLEWIEQNASFWSEVIEKYPSSTILLENIHESTPGILRGLLDGVNSPRLGVCLDTGHINVYSKVPVEEWFAVLGKDIRFMHVHDNKGDFDSHLATGKGTINWQEFSDLIAKYQIDPDITFEVAGLGQERLEATIQSLKYFREGNIYPFNTHGGNCM